MNKLHPGVKWKFRIGGYLSFGFLGIWIIIPRIIFSIGLVSGITDSPELISPFVLFSIFLYIPFVITASEIYSRMSYNRWFYEFSEDGLKLERGIIWKKYSNIPYERIQNVDVYRGIIARMFGFSTVMIQTAGFSGSEGAEGTIPAVEMNKAEEIRNFVMKKITSRKR